MSENKRAGICPDCGHFSRKYKVGTKIDFYVDCCGHCNGVWLDKKEWEVLKAEDLHDEINMIFTSPWQRRIADEATAGKLDTLCLEKFGAVDYEKVKGIRAWLQDHPNRNTLITFLIEKDPFSD